MTTRGTARPLERGADFSHTRGANATVSDEIMIPTLTPTSTIVATRDHVSCDLGGEVVILSLQNGIYYGLDAIGAKVWALLAEPHAVSEIRDALLREYDVEAERCERELLALLNDMAGHLLVHAVDVATS